MSRCRFCEKERPVGAEEARGPYCDDCRPWSTDPQKDGYKPIQQQIMHLLRVNNIKMSIEACGCCDGPHVTIQELNDAGDVTVEFADVPFCNIDMISDEYKEGCDE